MRGIVFVAVAVSTAVLLAEPSKAAQRCTLGNPDYFLSASGKTTPLCTPTSNAASCFVEGSGFAWNHGDFQNQITNTWLGMVGPGVLKKGRFGEIFSDHADIRPTILLLAGLEDDYAHDGRVLFEALSPLALPIGLKSFRIRSRLSPRRTRRSMPRAASLAPAPLPGFRRRR